MKKILSILSIFVLAFTLVACGGGSAEIDAVESNLGVLFQDPDNVKSGFNLPTEFEHEVTGEWKSSNEEYLKIGEEKSGIVTATVSRPDHETGDKKVKLTVTLKHGNKTKDWSIDLTIKAIDAPASLSDSFGESVTKENAGKTIVVENVALYRLQGTNGYYLSTADGVVAFVYGQTGMPEAGKLYKITATVENRFNSLQLKDVNFEEMEGTPDHKVTYSDTTIEDLVELPQPSAEHVYAHDGYTLKNVKILIDGTGNYNTFLVDKDFDPETDERTNKNSVMLYYVSQIAELRVLEGLVIEEINLLLEGYRTDLNVWYFSYVLPMEDLKLAELTVEEEVNLVKNQLTLPLEFEENGTLELPTTGDNDVTITWTFTDENNDNNELIDLATGKVTIPEEGRENVKLTATITKDDVEVTKEFEIAIGKHVLKTVADALALEDGRKIMVKGVVTGLFANRTYGFTDENGDSIAIYTSEALSFGKEYTLVGTKDNYNGLNQLKNIEIEDEKSGTLPEATDITALLEGYDVAEDLTEDALYKYVSSRVKVLGAEVTKVEEPNSYGNINVEITANGYTLQIRYDSRVANGANSEVLEALEVGDIVDYTGHLGWFNAPQLGFGLNSVILKEGEELTEELLATYDFTELSGKKGVEFNDGEALVETFNGVSDNETLLVSSSNVSKIYQGNGSGGGEAENRENLIKTGTGSLNGTMDLTFSKGITKVTLTLRGWGTTDKLTINGETVDIPADYDVVEFKFDAPTTMLSFLFERRALIEKIEIFG